MTPLLWGMLGGLIDLVLVAVALVLLAPRIARKAMRRQLQQSFGQTAAGGSAALRTATGRRSG